MTENEGAADRKAETFAEALADLKQRGSMLLLTGGAYDALDAACHRLIGESGEERRRLFVRTDRSKGPAAHAGGASTGGNVRVIDYLSESRSASAAVADDAPPVGTHTVDGDLSALQTAIEEEVAAFERQGALGAAELRVCLDSVDALLASHAREQVFQFLHALSGVVHDSQIMCHVHFPAWFDDESVQVLVPLFDAVIEVRSGPQQRWHLRDPELKTDWLSI